VRSIPLQGIITILLKLSYRSLSKRTADEKNKPPRSTAAARERGGLGMSQFAPKIQNLVVYFATTGFRFINPL